MELKKMDPSRGNPLVNLSVICSTGLRLGWGSNPLKGTLITNENDS